MAVWQARDLPSFLLAERIAGLTQCSGCSSGKFTVRVKTIEKITLPGEYISGNLEYHSLVKRTTAWGNGSDDWVLGASCGSRWRTLEIRFSPKLSLGLGWRIPASLCLVLKNTGVMSSASVRFLLFLIQSVEQSKFTSPHYVSTIENKCWILQTLETYLVEISAERMGKGVDFVKIELAAIFWACKCYTSPCCVYVYPKRGVVLGLTRVNAREKTVIKSQGVPTSWISGKLSTAPVDVVPTVATAVYLWTKSTGEWTMKLRTQDESFPTDFRVFF